VYTFYSILEDCVVTNRECKNDNKTPGTEADRISKFVSNIVISILLLWLNWYVLTELKSSRSARNKTEGKCGTFL